MTATASFVAPRLTISRVLVWLGFALVLIVAPLVLRGDLAMTMLAKAGFLVIVCLSYNILMGQGGLLSFAHAIFTGMGTLIAVHLMRLANSGGMMIPLTLVPICCGVFSACIGVFLGYISTKKAGTSFAMITMGIGELVAAMAQMFPGFFGGEGGFSTNRVYGPRLLGFTNIDFSTDLQVYYLIAAYCFICTLAMFAFTGTPLGRMLNAVRDNPERVEFIGYNTRRVRFYSFIISSFFAGIAGALAAINFEMVTADDSLSMASAGMYLLFVFLGGAGFFFGPVLGAVLMVLANSVLSQFTKAWLLYLGLAFVLMVMYAPGGIASLVMMNLRVARLGKFRRLVLPYLTLVVPSLMLVCGLAAVVEMIYHLQLDSGLGTTLPFLGANLDTSRPDHWVGSVLLLLIGLSLFTLARKNFLRNWNDVQEEIEHENQLKDRAAQDLALAQAKAAREAQSS